MRYQFDGYNYLVRIQKGELLIQSLMEFMAAENIRGAWVSAVGTSTWAELGYYQLDEQEYQWQKLDRTLEIVSLQGNAAWHEDKPFLHLHGVFSDPEMKTYGGHVRELEVAAACEIFLHLWNKDQLTRSDNAEVGLKLLDL